jgi:hypothetical protein
VHAGEGISIVSVNGHESETCVISGH